MLWQQINKKKRRPCPILSLESLANLENQQINGKNGYTHLSEILSKCFDTKSTRKKDAPIRSWAWKVLQIWKINRSTEKTGIPISQKHCQNALTQSQCEKKTPLSDPELGKFCNLENQRINGKNGYTHLSEILSKCFYNKSTRKKDAPVRSWAWKVWKI